MCDCIKKAEEEIKQQEAAALVQWEHFGTMSSQVRIVPLRKDGKASKVPKYISVDWKYCPLCGQKC
jgi:hypothetical protein